MTTEVANVIFTILYSIVLVLESMAIGYDIGYKRGKKVILDAIGYKKD